MRSCPDGAIIGISHQSPNFTPTELSSNVIDGILAKCNKEARRNDGKQNYFW
jgi:hypothetical protein